MLSYWRRKQITSHSKKQIASQKGALSPESVHNITSTAPHFTKTPVDFPESPPDAMSPKQKGAELPPISQVPVMRNVAQGTIRAQSAQQTLALNSMSSVHSIPSSCFVSPQLPTASDAALQGQLLLQRQYEDKSPPELKRSLGVEGSPFLSQQQWATNPQTAIHTMQHSVPSVYAGSVAMFLKQWIILKSSTTFMFSVMRQKGRMER